MRSYNDPAGSAPSDIGGQMNTFYWDKQALIEARKEQYFTQTADTSVMPKHFGKTMKRYHYIPLLDDQNINDQGIDAAGVALDPNKWEVRFREPTTTMTFAVEQDATDVAAALTIATKSGSATPWTITLDKAYDKIVVGSQSIGDLIAGNSSLLGTQVQRLSGNLYGSSKDVGTISGKLPALSEHGGRVNRVGHKRKEIEGTMEKFGFFDEYTKESLDFDSDPELEMHVRREMVNGANEMTEDALQIDLLNSAGVIRFAGDATSTSELDASDVVTYGDLLRLSIDLDNNRCPKQTKIITGTRLIDTRTIYGGRVMCIGSELLPTIKAMKDLHSNEAFIPVHKYAAGTTTLNGEVGSIDEFRIVVVPEMMKWAGKGADASGNSDCYETGNAFDVFPMLVVGDGAYSTIGFQTDGKSTKFRIIHRKPGDRTADRNEPYGETGFMSIKWWYGFFLLRPERLAVIKTVGKM